MILSLVSSEECTREFTCNNHGNCTETGDCDCDLDYEGTTCAQHKYIPSPKEAPSGVNLTVYGDNDFHAFVSHDILDKPEYDYSFLSYGSSAVIMNGSITVTDRTTVKFKLESQNEGKLQFIDKFYPDDYTASIETPELELLPNKLYHYSVYSHRGMMTLNKYSYLTWSKIGNNGYESIPKENTRIAPTEQTCIERYFGENCSDYCDADCNLNGECFLDSDKKSKCRCFDNYFGSNCQIYCNAKENCSSHGQCSLSGTCNCEPGFGGDHCERILTPTPYPSPSISPTMTFSPTASRSPVPTETQIPTMTPTQSPSLSVLPTITKNVTRSPTMTFTSSITFSNTPTESSQIIIDSSDFHISFTTDDQDDSKINNDKTSKIVAISMGASFGVILVLIIVICLYIRKRNRRYHIDQTPTIYTYTASYTQSINSIT